MRRAGRVSRVRVHMFNISALRREWLSNPRRDILAGIVVALALIPEAIGFSIIAGVDPRVGLYASFSIAVIISLVGGRPGMISAATAAIAVLVLPLVQRSRRRISVRRDHPDGRDPGDRRLPAAAPADAVCLALGHHRLRQRAGDPDLHGAAARTDRRADADLCAGRGGTGDHLPVPAPDQGGPFAAGRNRRC